MFGRKARLKVVVFESASGFRWQVWNGEDIIGVSPEGFATPTTCLEDWYEAGRQIAWFVSGGVADRRQFDFLDTPLGVEWMYWSPEGNPIARSAMPVPTLKEAQRQVGTFASAVIRRFDIPTEEQLNGQFR